jgi:ribosomal protein S18 acetylase RimI-like enzyme
LLQICGGCDGCEQEGHSLGDDRLVADLPTFASRPRLRTPQIQCGVFLCDFHRRTKVTNDPATVATPASPLTDAIRAMLRRAVAGDADAVRALTRDAYAKWVPMIGREPLPMTADYEAAVRDHIVDLLYIDDRLTALIEMKPEADHLLIINVAVSPACQGRGYGRALLQHAEELARTLRLPEIRLYTNGAFTDNVSLYRRVGYQLDREEHVPGRGVAVYMSKRLPVPSAEVPDLPSNK